MINLCSPFVKKYYVLENYLVCSFNTLSLWFHVNINFFMDVKENLQFVTRCNIYINLK